MTGWPVGEIEEINDLMKFGPGVLYPYSGESPKYTLDLDGTLWRCPACKVELPAGVIPFPHAADCRLGAGAVLHVIVPDIGDEVLRDLTWDWPPRP